MPNIPVLSRAIISSSISFTFPSVKGISTIVRFIYFTDNAKLSRLFWSTLPFSSGFKPKRISSSPASFNDLSISSVTKSPFVYILV